MKRMLLIVTIIMTLVMSTVAQSLVFAEDGDEKKQALLVRLECSGGDNADYKVILDIENKEGQTGQYEYYTYVDGNKTVDISGETTRIEATIRKSGFLEVYGLLSGQKYTLTVKGMEERKYKIEYLCTAGRVKESRTGIGEDNSIKTIIRDHNADKDKVTDPGYINYVVINAYRFKEDTPGIPVRFDFDIADGSFFGEEQEPYRLKFYVEFDDADNLYWFDNQYVLKLNNKSKREDDEYLIEYDPRAATLSDITGGKRFTLERILELPPEVFQPNKTWKFVVTPRLYYYYDLTGQEEYLFTLETDEEGNIKNYSIKKTVDYYGNNVDEEVEGFRFETAYRQTGDIVIKKNAPSDKDQLFDFRATVNIPAFRDEVSNLHRYAFMLHHGREFVISDVPFGSTYTVREKIEPGFTAGVVIKDGMNVLKSKDLEQSDGNHIAKDIYVGRHVTYSPMEIDEDSEPIDYVPCAPPIVPETSGIYDAFSLGMLWNNLKGDELRLEVRKKDPTSENNPGGTLKGAKFTLGEIVPNSYYERYTYSLMQTVTTDENGTAVFTGLDKDKAYLIQEAEAPQGYAKPSQIIVYFPDGFTGDKDKILERMEETVTRWGYDQSMMPLEKTILGPEDIDGETNTLNVDVIEKPAYTHAEVQKFLLADPDAYDGKLFEVKTFNKLKDLAGYKDAKWPRSFFDEDQEKVSGIEFIMTLDSHPDDPMYTYRAVTDGKGNALFERVAELTDEEKALIESDESYSDIRNRVYYGSYTIKEVNPPEGMSALEPQKVLIDPKYRNKKVNLADNPDDPPVMDYMESTLVRVVNTPEEPKKDTPDDSGSGGGGDDTDRSKTDKEEKPDDKKPEPVISDDDADGDDDHDNDDGETGKTEDGSKAGKGRKSPKTGDGESLMLWIITAAVAAFVTHRMQSKKRGAGSGKEKA